MLSYLKNISNTRAFLCFGCQLVSRLRTSIYKLLDNLTTAQQVVQELQEPQVQEPQVQEPKVKEPQDPGIHW